MTTLNDKEKKLKDFLMNYATEQEIDQLNDFVKDHKFDQADTLITQLAQQAQEATKPHQQLDMIILILQDAIRRLKEMK